MKRGKCIHFNGIQNERCERNVSYSVNWPDGPPPCIQHELRSVKKPCPFREEPTSEQVEASRREDDEEFEKFKVALKVANAWRVNPKPAVNRADIVECPVCNGKLHLRQSARNGHVTGQCETARCVFWME